MWTISFALGPCVLTSFESGAGLCLAETEIEIHPSTTCCEVIFTGFSGGLTHMQNFEVRLQKSNSPCTKWLLAIKGVGSRKSRAWLWRVELRLKPLPGPDAGFSKLTGVQNSTSQVSVSDH